MLTRDSILAAVDLPREEVEVPEWGGSVMVQGLSGWNRSKVETTMMDKAGNRKIEGLADFRMKMVILCCVDEGGAQLFSESDAKALGKKSAVAIERVFDVALRLSGMSQAAQDAAEGNSAAALSGDLSTD